MSGQKIKRRDALKTLGLTATALYLAPVLSELAQARAGDNRSNARTNSLNDPRRSNNKRITIVGTPGNRRTNSTTDRRSRNSSSGNRRSGSQSSRPRKPKMHTMIGTSKRKRNRK